MNELERDAAPLRVQSGVDCSHPACTETTDDPERAYTAGVARAGGMDTRGQRGS